MTWRSHNAATHFEALQDSWDSVNRRLFAGNPFFDGRFMRCLLSHFGTGTETLWVHTAGQNIDGMLVIWNSPSQYTLFAPSQAQILPVLVEHPETIFGLVPRLSPFCLALNLPYQDPDCSRVYALGEDVKVRKEPNALTMSIEVAGTFDDYWLSRSKKLRSNIQRYLNRVAGAGLTMRLACHTDPDSIVSAFARYADLESRSWKAKGGTEVASTNIQGRFYSDLLNVFSLTESAVVYELLVGEQVAASRLCIRSSDMLVMLKTTYDESLAHLAVGRLLLFYVLQEEFATKRVKRIEFYTHASPDQLSWSTHRREIDHFTIYRYAWVGNLHRRLRARRRTVAAATSPGESNDSA
jgi:GNAT acetyltransferase-like protein